jgi:uncharacterized RDD family membrane protein YckC
LRSLYTTGLEPLPTISPILMSDLIIPAPITRRLAAAVYDGLLYVALLLACLLLSVILRDALGLAPSIAAWNRYCKTVFLLVGLGFFGWFWTHGGQTVGMIAWRLQLRRDDGAALRWPVAAIRYAGMLLFWVLALAPGVLALPSGIVGNNISVAAAGGTLTVLNLWWTLMDSRRRTLYDRLSSCEVVLLPPRQRAPETAS